MTKRFISILTCAVALGFAGSALAEGSGCLRQNTASAEDAQVPSPQQTPAGTTVRQPG